MPGSSRSASKECSWRPNALRSASMSITPRCVAVEHDQPGARAEDRRAARARARAAARPSPSRSMPSVIVVDSPPGMTSPSSPSRSAGTRTSRTSAPRSRRIRGVRVEAALQREDPDQGRRAYQPRPARSCVVVELARLERLHRRGRGPRRRRRRARRRGSASWPRRSPRRARSGSSDLKMPEPTKTDSAPSCITSDGVGRRGDAAGAEQRDRQLALARRPRGRGRAAPAAPWPRSPASCRPASRGGGSRR